MDLQAPCCNACYSLHRPPQLHAPPSSVKFPSSSAKCTRKTTSQLPTPAAVAAQNGSTYSPSTVPTHKVTVHDRQTGVVHEFFVPEGYALLCVGFPSTDLEVETQDEDEVYWLQFGRYFARGPIERDDYALELAMADE
nr:ferredoxin C 2, chloroplastic [Ipomoea batatas]